MKHWPETAEKLMRSRYSAYVLGEIDYLLASKSAIDNRIEEHRSLLEMNKKIHWLGLRVLSTQMGREDDNCGEVEFAAYYLSRRNTGGAGNEIVRGDVLHEHSYFQKINNRWLYTKGVSPKSLLHFPGRNDPCWCGSNKKFKKCHRD